MTLEYTSEITFNMAEDKEFTLNYDEFLKCTKSCLDDWFVPTIEGPSVDIWLIKQAV